MPLRQLDSRIVKSILLTTWFLSRDVDLSELAAVGTQVLIRNPWSQRIACEFVYVSHCCRISLKNNMTSSHTNCYLMDLTRIWIEPSLIPWQIPHSMWECIPNNTNEFTRWIYTYEHRDKPEAYWSGSLIYEGTGCAWRATRWMVNFINNYI